MPKIPLLHKVLEKFLRVDIVPGLIPKVERFEDGGVLGVFLWNR